jgi:Iap family predicted aminopeptidase
MMLSQIELEDLVRKAIVLYNRFRSPEATAKLISVTPENVTVAFSGSFCYSCGVLDYIEDFIHEFKILTDKVGLKIGKTRQTSPRSFEVDYKIKFQ